MTVVCPYCVQYRCVHCKQDQCPESCPGWPMSGEYEPYWPDGSVAEITMQEPCERCAQALADYAEECRRDPT